MTDVQNLNVHCLNPQDPCYFLFVVVESYWTSRLKPGMLRVKKMDYKLMYSQIIKKYFPFFICTYNNKKSPKFSGQRMKVAVLTI